MIFNNSVTLYHASCGSYIRKYFVRTCVFGDEKIKTGSGGQISDDSAVVRIFTHDTPEISPGDRLIFGYSESLTPPPDSHVILSVTKNCRGTGHTRHYKLKVM